MGGLFSPFPPLSLITTANDALSPGLNSATQAYYSYQFCSLPLSISILSFRSKKVRHKMGSGEIRLGECLIIKGLIAMSRRCLRLHPNNKRGRTEERDGQESGLIGESLQ